MKLTDHFILAFGTSRDLQEFKKEYMVRKNDEKGIYAIDLFKFEPLPELFIYSKFPLENIYVGLLIAYYLCDGDFNKIRNGETNPFMVLREICEKRWHDEDYAYEDYAYVAIGARCDESWFIGLQKAVEIIKMDYEDTEFCKVVSIVEDYSFMKKKIDLMKIAETYCHCAIQYGTTNWKQWCYNEFGTSDRYIYANICDKDVYGEEGYHFVVCNSIGCIHPLLAIFEMRNPPCIDFDVFCHEKYEL